MKPCSKFEVIPMGLHRKHDLIRMYSILSQAKFKNKEKNLKYRKYYKICQIEIMHILMGMIQ